MSKKERLDESNVGNTISHMKLTNEHEKALSAGTSYWDCFKGIDLRRTEVACLTWAAQNMCGRCVICTSLRNS
jgi:SP family general alpha glucoside:H+ symporter-like MFS transporter